MIKKSKGHGTTINFLPDDEIFDTVKFGAEEVKNRLHQTAYLNPKLIIHYEDKRKKEVESITFHEEEGIIGLVKSMTKDSETVQDAPVSVSVHNRISRKCDRILQQYLHNRGWHSPDRL